MRQLIPYLLKPNRANKRKQIEDRPVVPTCIYFIETNPFPEVDKFMEETKKLLNLNIIEVERNFKVSMKKLVENHSLKAVIMGSRRTDPYCDRLDKITASDVDKGTSPTQPVAHAFRSSRLPVFQSKS